MQVEVFPNGQETKASPFLQVSVFQLPPAAWLGASGAEFVTEEAKAPGTVQNKSMRIKKQASKQKQWHNIVLHNLCV